MTGRGEGAARVAALRAGFDGGFAEAPREADGPERAWIDLLLVRIGAEAYAIRSTDIASIHAGLVVSPMPTRDPAFLGLTTLRNALVPVFDLAALLGIAATGAPRWCVLSPGEAPLGFSFAAFDGHARIAPRTWQPDGALLGAFEHAGATRRVLDPGVMAAPMQRSGRGSAAKES